MRTQVASASLPLLIGVCHYFDALTRKINSLGWFRHLSTRSRHDPTLEELAE
jgi:hypothetical protein